MTYKVSLFVFSLLLSACSQETTLQEEKEEEGQFGASSGPNSNFDGASAADEFGQPTPKETPPGAATPEQTPAESASTTAP